SCTKGATVNIGAKDAASGWHKIQNTPSNKLAVLSNATLSTELYNPDGTLFRRMPDTTHMDFGYDSDGVTEVAVGMFYQGTAQHRSRSSVGYWAQPRGAISKDGKVVIFDSNFNNFNGGSSTVSGWDYADTYMIRVQQ